MAAREQTIDVEGLVAEIHAYLEAVELFRAEGREPRWGVDSRGRKRAARRGSGAEEPVFRASPKRKEK